jgi:hypothetical protein
MEDYGGGEDDGRCRGMIIIIFNGGNATGNYVSSFLFIN